MSIHLISELWHSVCFKNRKLASTDVDSNGNELGYITWMGLGATGKWDRTNKDGVIKTCNVESHRVVAGLDIGQGQISMSDGSTSQVDDAGLAKAVSEHDQKVGGVNAYKQEIVSVPYIF